MACHPPGMPVPSILQQSCIQTASFPILGRSQGSSAVARQPRQEGCAITDSQEKNLELPLCWPGRRGAPSELSSTFPLLSPVPSAPCMGPHFPLDTRPYSSPRGLRLPAASLCTDASIPAARRSPGAVRQSWPLLGDGATPAHPCSHPTLPPCWSSALFPTARAWPL